MRLDGRMMRCALGLMLLVLVSGCGGISTSHSVSPASFFLPGLVEAEPETGLPPAEAVESGLLVAQAD